MEGVGHPAFRDLTAARGGVRVVCTEFVRITNAPANLRQLERQVHRSEGAALSVQVMGNAPRQLADAARIVSRAGADVVDINLGCPMPRVVRKGVGAAMLKDLQLLFAVVSALREATDRLLSAKIRAGYDDASNVECIALTLQRAGVDFIVVHPRRRCDFYQSVADWRIIELLKGTLSVPVVGNGDIWYAADALRMLEETGCDAVMLGRPAIRNPWIFQQIEALQQGRPAVEPTGRDIVEYLETVARAYTERLVRKHGPLGPLKEIVRWLGRAVRDGGAFQKQALRTQSVDALLDVARQRLPQLSARELDLDAHGRQRLEPSASTRIPSLQMAAGL